MVAHINAEPALRNGPVIKIICCGEIKNNARGRVQNVLKLKISMLVFKEDFRETIALFVGSADIGRQLFFIAIFKKSLMSNFCKLLEKLFT